MAGQRKTRDPKTREGTERQEEQGQEEWEALEGVVQTSTRTGEGKAEQGQEEKSEQV